MTEPAKSKGTILVVDDEPDLLWLMTNIFAPLGYATLTAQSGEQALDFLASSPQPIDLMMIDVRLPGLNGIETAKEARKRQPELAMIVTSGLKDYEKECAAIGVRHFILKPYSLDEVCRTVTGLLEKEKTQTEEPEAQIDLSSGVFPSAKLLIVDDEPEVAQLIGEALFEDFPDAEFKVRAAHSGQEALKISKTFEPDIAIVDIKMPGMSGDELIRRFKAGEGYCPRDFIVYTGVTDSTVIAKAQNLGHKVLTKPTNIEILYEVLVKICQRNHLLRKTHG